MAYYRHMAEYDSGESIYKIIPPKIIREEKPPMYRSKHAHDVPASASTFHQTATTHPLISNMGGEIAGKVVPDRSARGMGKPPGSNSNTPRDYMRKKAHTDVVATLTDLKVKNPDKLEPSDLKPKLKSSTPSRHDQPVMNLVTSKNFIVANAVENILAAPKKISPGAKDYLAKEDYGKVPKYLQHVKADVQAEYDYIQRLEQERADMTRSNVRQIHEEERLALIEDLKQKWEHVNTEYQGYTHITKLDTVGKKRRKENWEAALTQIEKDVEKLNRKNIMVNGDM
jgi:hypothetical protein